MSTYTSTFMAQCIGLLILLLISVCPELNAQEPERSRVIISTDIGGSDPDDFQSMVHFLVYADRFEIEGLISSPPHDGRKEHIDEVIQAYRKDYPNLKRHSEYFPDPDHLSGVTYQGAVGPQKEKTPSQLSDGALRIIDCALKDDPRPVYVLVWGSITDVAQAVHREPAIKQRLRIYSIGSWNTVQDSLSRDYLFHHHPDLWWIESNTTFRGMYMGGHQQENYGNRTFVETYVKPFGALGQLFYEKKPDIKMGDTPSVLYLLHGDPGDPGGQSWGGSYLRTGHGNFFWTDNPVDSLVENNRPGAKTVNKFRKDFLNDWAVRMSWTRE